MITFGPASDSLTDTAQLPWRWAESTVKPRNILRHRGKYYFNDYYTRRALSLFSDHQNIEIFIHLFSVKYCRKIHKPFPIRLTLGVVEAKFFTAFHTCKCP